MRFGPPLLVVPASRPDEAPLPTKASPAKPTAACAGSCVLARIPEWGRDAGGDLLLSVPAFCLELGLDTAGDLGATVGGRGGVKAGWLAGVVVLVVVLLLLERALRTRCTCLWDSATCLSDVDLVTRGAGAGMMEGGGALGGACKRCALAVLGCDGLPVLAGSLVLAGSGFGFVPAV